MREIELVTMLAGVNIQIIFYLLLSCIGLAASDVFVSVRHMNALVEKWQPDQHLYVKGDVGVSIEGLNQLEQWLDANGKNWTVVLSQTMSGERYRDAGQRSYSGVRAAEFILSRGLGNKSLFINQKDENSGRSNGVIFVISLNDRSFSYFAEEAYEQFGLGHTDWRGQLDQPARRAMQRGQLVQAVRQTVQSVDSRFDLRTSEARAQLEAARMRESELKEQLVTRVFSLREDVEVLKKAGAEFQSEFGSGYSGDIGVVEEDIIVGELKQAERALKLGDTVSAGRVIRDAEDRLAKQRKAMKDWRQDQTRISGLMDEAKAFELDPDAVDVVGAKEQLKILAEKAQLSYGKRNSVYREELAGFDAKLDHLYTLNEQALQAREIRNRQRKIKQKVAATGGGVVMVGGLLAAGASRRRRKKPKQKAEMLLAERKSWLSARTDELFALQDRAELVVGSSDALEERGYKGLTLSVSEQVIRSVDHAYILTAGVDSLMQRASELVEPSGAVAKIQCGFSRARFDAAIELLQDEPVKIEAGDPVSVRGKDDTALLGGVEKEGFELNFSELRSDFRSSITIAEEGLDRVESAWEVIAETMKVLEENSAELNQLHDKLYSSGSADGFMLIPSFDSRWMERLTKDLIEAHDVAQHDPVKVIEELLVDLDEVHHEMGLLLRGVETMREEGMSYVQAFQRKLETEGHENGWVEDEMEELSNRLDLVAQQGANASVLGMVDAWCHESEAFAKSCQRGSELLNGLAELRVDIEQVLVPELRRVRTQLSRVTNVPEALVLREDGGPEGQIQHAQEGLVQLEEALDEGRVDLADEELAQATLEVASARSIIADSTQAQEDYVHRLENYEGLLAKAKGALVEHSEIDGFLRQRYFDKVLGERVVGALDQVKEFLTHMSELSGTVKTAYQQGELLKTKYLLDVGGESAAAVTSRYELLRNAKKKMEELEQENKSLCKSLVNQCEGVSKTLNDPKVSVDTQRMFSELESTLSQAEQGMKEEFGLMNPLLVMDQLEHCGDIYDAVIQGVERDRDAHARVEELAVLVSSELNVLTRLIDAAQSDGVVDSKQVNLCVEKVSRINSAAARIREESQDHANWVGLREQTNEILDEAEETKFILSNEVRAAKEALHAVQSAEGSLSQAIHWQFSYGVRANCGAASSALQKAHEELSRGNYQAALRGAGLARNKARQALSFAQSQESTIRRRRSLARRRRSPSFGIGIGGGRSSNFSGRSSSGGSSGFGSSGW